MHCRLNCQQWRHWLNLRIPTAYCDAKHNLAEMLIQALSGYTDHKDTERVVLMPPLNVLHIADTGGSALAVDLGDEEVSDGLRVWRQASKLFDAATRKAHPRPLIISRLSTAGDTSGYSACLSGEASLLSAFTVQVLPQSSESVRP